MLAHYTTGGQVFVALDEGETLAFVEGPATLEIVPLAGLELWDALQESGVAIGAVSPNAPDNPTNSDWRVGLVLWGRFAEVEAKVIAARDGGTVQGLIAWQRWEYANNVLRNELMQLMDVFGFTAGEVDESLWRADRVRQGDLSGVWPLQAKREKA